jgi:hypothetical protein
MPQTPGLKYGEGAAFVVLLYLFTPVAVDLIIAIARALMLFGSRELWQIVI